jgi:hypothetical protein
METLKFELPSKLWKVSKRYSTIGVNDEHISKLQEIEHVLYFKSVSLAEDYYSKFTWGYTEMITIDDMIYDLKVITKITEINTIEIIPTVIDL